MPQGKLLRQNHDIHHKNNATPNKGVALFHTNSITMIRFNLIEKAEMIIHNASLRYRKKFGKGWSGV